MSSAANYLIDLVFNLASFIFIARFLLQACRANFYNPVSQGLVQITDPVLKPLRIVLPAYKNLDFASFVMAWVATLIWLFVTTNNVAIPLLIGESALRTVLLIITFLTWSIFGVIILSFLSPGNPHPVVTLLQEITEPILAPARKLLPAFGGLDFSPMIVLIGLHLLSRILPDLYTSLVRAVM